MEHKCTFVNFAVNLPKKKKGNTNAAYNENKKCFYFLDFNFFYLYRTHPSF